MKMTMSALKFLLLSIATTGLALSVARVAAAATADSGGKVVATVGSMKITEAQLNDKARPQLAAIESQVYTVKKRTLDDMIDDYLIDKAAKKAGLSKDAYLKKEVEDKAAAPTEQEMKDFYDKNQARIRQPYDKIKVPLEQYMKRQKVSAQRSELMAQLRKDASVKVMLKVPTVEVSTQYSAGSTGPSNAPITIVEFSDYQCPYCQRAEASVQEVTQEVRRQSSPDLHGLPAPDASVRAQGGPGGALRRRPGQVLGISRRAVCGSDEAGRGRA